jgi:hypothetical protein
MRHTKNEGFSTEFSELIDGKFHTGDKRPGTFESKSLGGVEFLGHEVTPHL